MIYGTYVHRGQPYTTKAEIWTDHESNSCCTVTTRNRPSISATGKGLDSAAAIGAAMVALGQAIDERERRRAEAAREKEQAVA